MKHAQDPKGLIHDSYRIDGITAPECRSIFLDWAISVPEGVEAGTAARSLLDIYAADHPDHPMTQVLEEALLAPAATGRRGGARARRS
jgi:hypothetical protein